jgi:hypothetical protein
MRFVPALLFRRSLPLLVCLLLARPCVADTTGPLCVTPPTIDWHVHYQGGAVGDVYTLEPPEGHIAAFTLARWTPPSRVDQLPHLLATISAHFAAAAQGDPKIVFDKPDPAQGEIIGDPFTGRYAAYSLKGGLLEVLFLLSDGKTLWHGHYVGPAAGWDDARRVLEVLKKW